MVFKYITLLYSKGLVYKGILVRKVYNRFYKSINFIF